jgi:tetratricopeptide (TPR) repeat protein
MIWHSAGWRTLLLALSCAAWTGCNPSLPSSLDEQRDLYFLSGKNRANGLDYQGAVEAYKKALEVNPRSGSAHFELGWLYEQKLTNYPAAIYHFENYLQLRPRSDNEEIVKARILACKQEIARSVNVGPVTPALQRDMERLTQDNTALRQQVDWLNRRLAILTNTPVQSATRSNAESISIAASNPPPMIRTPLAVPNSIRAVPPPAAARSHVIKAGDTLAIVARKYGVKLTALQAANPHLDSRRLRPGQTVVIPPP